MTKPTGKDVIYIDVDDEITGIIDKVKGSKQKIVALVLPKRATVLQSVVNMKLLKRSADASKKQLVLVTSEAGLLPLAGTVGLYTAKSLQSKPEIPEGAVKKPEKEDDQPEEPIEDEEPEPEVDKSKPVGELAGADAEKDSDDVIELDNEADDGPATPVAGALAKDAKKKNKQFKIPNFNKFRLMLVAGAIGLGLLIAAYIVAFKVLPTASISINTDSTAIELSTDLNLKTAADTKLDVEQNIVPATSQSVQKTQSQQVAATGQQNNGQKASGQVTIHNCTSSPVTIPAGTGVSASGLTFITQQSLNLDSGNFNGPPSFSCKNNGSHVGTVNVVAQKAGAAYNVEAQNYTVAGYSSLTANGSAMSGGTDDIIKIVTQADIDNAKQKVNSQDANPIRQELTTGLEDKDLYAIQATYKATDPQVKTSANPGDQADTVTVTQTTTFTMLGVKESDLKKVIDKAAKEKIDTKKQKILDYGLDSAQFNTTSQDANGAVVTMDTTIIAGPELDTEAIKQQVAGKKAGDAEAIIKKNPGVTDVTVTYSPFWVSSIPTNTSKITITVEKPQVKTDAKSSAP